MTLYMCVDCWARRWFRVRDWLLWSQSDAYRLRQHDLCCTAWFCSM